MNYIATASVSSLNTTCNNAFLVRYPLKFDERSLFDNSG